MADNINVSEGSGKVIAGDEVSGILHQRIKRSVGADGAAVDYLDKASRSDTYNATGNGTTVDVSAQAMKCFSLQVVENGTVASWTVVLEGSLDGTNFQILLTHTKAANGSGGVTGLQASASPYLYFRSRCTAYGGGGTNIAATIVGTS